VFTEEEARRAHWLSCVNLEDFTVTLKFAK
jgi:hypothetical protein